MSVQIHKQSWDAQAATLSCVSGGRNTGKVFATAWDDRVVRAFALGQPKPVLELEGLENPAAGLAFNPTEEVLAAGDDKGMVQLWSLKQGKVARTLEGGQKAASEIAFHPSGAFAAVAGADLTTRVWDLRERRCVQTYSAHERTTMLAFSPGTGSWIISGGDNGLTKVWDVRAGKIVATLKKHTGPVTHAQFHPSELALATGGADGVVQFWNMEDFSKIAASAPTREPVRGLAFGADGMYCFAVHDAAVRAIPWKPTDPALAGEISTALPWQPVRDAFARRDKLFVASSASPHAPVAYIVALGSILKPLDAENVPPAPTETVAAKKPALEEPVPAPVPVVKEVPVSEPQQTPAPVVESVAAAAVVPVAPAPVLEEQQPQPPPQKQQQEALPPPLARSASSSAPEGSKSQKSGSRIGGSGNSGSHRQRSSSNSSKTSVSSKPSSSSSSSSGVVSSNSVAVVPSDRAAALGLRAEDFRSKMRSFKSDDDALTWAVEDHANVCAVLSTRKTHVAAVRAMWNKDQIWKAVTQLKDAKDLSVTVDVFANLPLNGLQVVPLELLNVLLQEMLALVSSEYEDYAVLGCSMLRAFNKVHAGVIKSTREKTAEARSDAQLAERLELSNVCWDTLTRCAMQLKENLACPGRVASASREALAMFRKVGLTV